MNNPVRSSPKSKEFSDLVRKQSTWIQSGATYSLDPNFKDNYVMANQLLGKLPVKIRMTMTSMASFFYKNGLSPKIYTTQMSDSFGQVSFVIILKRIYLPLNFSEQSTTLQICILDSKLIFTEIIKTLFWQHYAFAKMIKTIDVKITCSIRANTVLIPHKSSSGKLFESCFKESRFESFMPQEVGLR
jgi:hypothetical protein